MTEIFDQRYQSSFNGYLSPQLQGRIETVRIQRKLTLDEVGRCLGISGSFLGNILNGKRSIRSKHIPILLERLERLERGEISDAPRLKGEGRERHIPPLTHSDQSSTSLPEKSSRLLAEASLEELAERANDLGFAVTFTQLPAR